MVTRTSRDNLKRGLGVLVTSVLTMGFMTAMPVAAQAVDVPSIVISPVTENASSDTDPLSINVPIDISGFDSSPVVAVTLRLTSEQPGTLTINNTSGLTLTSGFTSFSGESEIGFKGSLATATSALANNIYWNTPQASGTVPIEVTIGPELPAGLILNPANGHLYEFVNQSVSWSTAMSRAASYSRFGMTGYLATVTNSVENSFITSRLTTSSIWLAGGDQNGSWKWYAGPENGTGIGYSRWGFLEPGNFGKFQGCGFLCLEWITEDRLAMNYGLFSGYWRDMYYNENANFVVEYGGLAGQTSTYTPFTVSEDLTAVSRFQSFIDYAEANAGTRPSLVEVLLAELEDVLDESTLNAIITALATSSIDGEDVDSRIELQTIADAFNRILAYANGLTTNDGLTAPTASDFTSIGASIASALSTEELGLANDVIARRATAEVDDVNEIEALAAIIDRVTATTSLDSQPTPALSAADFSALGVTGVNSSNIKTARAVLRGKTASAVDTVAEIQNLIDPALVAANAYAIIINYANANTGTKPTVDNFADAGVVGVTSGNLKSILSSLATTFINSDEIPSATEITSLVNAFIAILNEAGAGSTDVTGEEFQLVGVENASTYEPEVISLVNSIVDQGPVTKFDTVNELVAYFNIVNKIIYDPQSLTVNELLALGFTGVTAENLQYVIDALVAASDLTSLSLLTVAVNAGVTAGNAAFMIQVYAETNAGLKPTLSTYSDALVVGVTVGNIGLLNSMLASENIDLGEVDTLAKLNELAAAADSIVNFYDETAYPSSGMTWNFFAGAGFAIYNDGDLSEAQSDSAVRLFGSVANSFKGSNDFDTYNEIQSFLNITQAIVAQAGGLTFWRTLTAADLGALNMTYVDPAGSDLSTILDAITSTADDGSEVDTVVELGGLVVGTGFDYSSDQATIDAFTSAHVYFWPNAAMWNTVTGRSNITVENVYFHNSMAYSPIFTNFTSSTVATDIAASTIVGYAGDSIVAPSVDDYISMNVDQASGFTSDSLNFFNALVKAMEPADVDTVGHLNSLADIVNTLYANPANMSVYDWHALGFTDVNSEILADVNTRVIALEALTFVGIGQAIADAKIAVVSWRAIKVYADTNIGDAPTALDFSAVGVSLPIVDGFLDAMVDVLASAAVTAADTSSAVDIQDLVDSLTVLFNWADGQNLAPVSFATVSGMAGPSSQTAPTVEDYAALNANIAASLSGDSLALLNDILADKVAADLDIPSDIENLAFIVSTLYADAYSVSLSGISALGGTGVTEENLIDVQNRLSSGIALINSVETLQEQINAGVNAQQLLIDAIALIQSYSDANGGTAPTLSTYVDLDISLTFPSNVAELNTVWTSVGVTSSDVPTLSDIQAIVAAYERLISGTASDSDLAFVGDDFGTAKLAVDEVLPLFNSINDYLGDASTVAELSAIAAASHQAITAPDDMTLADFQDLSLTSVTEDTFGMVKQAMSLVAADARNSRAKILSLISSGIAVGMVSLGDLNDFANGTGSTPSISDYEAAGIDGVTADNLATINSMLLAGIPAAPFTAAQLQAAFDAYLVILEYANGATPQGDLEVPTSGTFNLATNVDMSYFTSDSLGFLVDLVGRNQKSALDTVDELSGLIDAVDHLFRSQNELTLADLIALGFTDVTEDTLAAIKAALQANSGSLTDLAFIQNLISQTAVEALSALAIIRAYADDQTVVPSVEDYTTAGLSGVNEYNLAEVNQAIADVGGSDVNTTAKIQAIIIDANADMVLALVVAHAAGGAGDAPLAGAYKMVGIGGVVGPSEEWATMISMFVHSNPADSYDTLDELLALADATYAISNNPGNLTVEDFGSIGYVGVTEANLLRAATALVSADLTSTNSVFAAITAALDLTVPNAPSALALSSKSIRISWVVESADAQDATVTVRNSVGAVVCEALATDLNCDIAGLKSKTRYSFEVTYSNMGYNKVATVEVTTLKTPGPYKVSRVLFNAYSSKVSVAGTKALWDLVRNIRKRDVTVIEITGAVQKTGYTGNDARLALKRAAKLKTWFRDNGITVKIVIKRSKPVALSDIAGRQATVKLFD